MTTTDLTGGRGWLRADAAASLHRIDKQLGHRLQITSAGRSAAEQQKLVDLWRSGQGAYAAPVGTSPHETGRAIDTDEGKRVIDVMVAHGWYRPLSSEPWHWLYVPKNDRYRDTTPAVSKDVKNQQSWLNKARGEHLKVDGIRGPETIAAYKRYQKFLGVTADGDWGDRTQAAHQKYYDRWAADHAASWVGVLRNGSSGKAVKILQARLNRDYPAYSKLTVDGKFGPATERVVREFQKRAGLTVDGIAGKKTLGKLGLSLAELGLS